MMNTLIPELIGLLCTHKIMMLLILIDSFRIEYIPKEIWTFNGNKNIKTNNFRIQAYDSIMCRYHCIEFTEFMLGAGKT